MITIPLAALIALLAIYGTTLTAFIGTIVFLALRLGRLPTREDHNDLRSELKTDMAQLREDFKTDMAQLREDFKAENARLREDFRRSHQQLMLALANHSHRDDGQAVFTLPPEVETTPSPADN